MNLSVSDHIFDVEAQMLRNKIKPYILEKELQVIHLQT